MFLKNTFWLLVIFVPASMGLIGGQALTAGQIAADKYGTGLYVIGSDNHCICVWVSTLRCMYPVNVCGRFENPNNDQKLNIMGKEYSPVISIAEDNCYQHSRNYGYLTLTNNLPPSSTLPPVCYLIPPTGTKCRFLGFSGSTKSPPVANYLDTVIIDFNSCKQAWHDFENGLVDTIIPERHFCAQLWTGNGPNPLTDNDFPIPIYCQPWWHIDKNGSKGKIFKPFWGDDDDEDEEDQDVGTTRYTVFAGFQFLDPNSKDIPTVFEAPLCPEDCH